MLPGYYRHGQFPPGWAKLYDGWRSGEITTREFFDGSGLKPQPFLYALQDWMYEHGGWDDCQPPRRR